MIEVSALTVAIAGAWLFVEAMRFTASLLVVPVLPGFERAGEFNRHIFEVKDIGEIKLRGRSRFVGWFCHIFIIQHFLK